MPLAEDEFIERVSKLPGGRRRLPEYQKDLALTLLVRLNCTALPEDLAAKVPRWVLGGGFAIRHCFGGERFSRDGDLSYDAELALKPDKNDLQLPVGFEKVDEESRDDVSRVHVKYRRKWGHGLVFMDINHARPINDPPAQQRDFVSPFIDPFKVLVESTDEILADKLCGFVKFRSEGDTPRAKDMHDLNHMFRTGETFNPEIVRKLFREEMKSNLIVLVNEVLDLERYRDQWDREMPSLLDKAPMFDNARGELRGHLADHFA